MRYLLLMVPPVALSACMGTGPDRPGRPPFPGVQCNAGPAQRFVGAPFRPRVAQQAKRMARARVVRAVRPGQAVTMDFRADRLNVETDERNRVSALRCG